MKRFANGPYKRIPDWEHPRFIRLADFILAVTALSVSQHIAFTIIVSVWLFLKIAVTIVGVGATRAQSAFEGLEKAEDVQRQLDAVVKHLDVYASNQEARIVRLELEHKMRGLRP